MQLLKSIFRLHWTKFLGPRKTLNSKSRSMLKENSTKDEVLHAVQDWDPGKAPRPDGFNFRFIKHFWRMLKADVMQFFCLFHLNAKLVKGLNSTFITLIPKLEGAELLGNFRPISFVGCFNKILAKVLANR